MIEEYGSFHLPAAINYWVESIMNPTKPAATSPNEEIDKYDFRKGVGQALGGGAVVESSSEAAPDLPKIAPRPKKKRVEGGC